jgi:NADH:ubiquinone oxidoreductase subunit 11 or 4L (chain K)
MTTALLIVSAGLLAVGLFGVAARRGILMQLVSLEVALSGPALAFVAVGAQRGDPEGQGMFVIVLALAAAEAAVGLALYLRLARGAPKGDSDAARSLEG